MKKLIISLILFILCLNLALADLVNDTVAYYKEDTNGQFEDSAGSVDGYLDNPTYTASGKINGAYDWDGTDIVSLGDNFDYSTTPMSISFWLNPDSVSSTNQRYATSGTGTGTTRGWLIFNFGSGGLGWGDTAGFKHKASVLTAGTWQHVVVVYDGGSGFDKLRMYVDGSLITGTSTAGTFNGFQNTDVDTLIGGQNSTGTVANKFAGLIDEFAIFDTNISADNVTFLYNSGNGIQYPYGLLPVNFTASLNYPVNETNYHLVGANASKVFNGSINIEVTGGANCSLNNSLFSWVSVINEVNNWVNNSVITDGEYDIFANCSNGVDEVNFSFNFVIDTTDPNIDVDNPINNSVHYNELILNVSYSDLYLFRTNTTISRVDNGQVVYNNYSGDLPDPTTWYNITKTLNLTNGSYDIGKFKLFLEAVDTHTKKDFKEKVTKTKTIIKRKGKNQHKTDLKLKHGNFTIIHDTDLDIDLIKAQDRVKFNHKKTTKEQTSITITGDKLIYHKNSHYPCHFIVNDKYWYDCVGFQNPRVTKITETEYKITYTHDKNEVITDSLGGLNEINKTYFFYVVNQTTGVINIGDQFFPPDVNFNYTASNTFSVSSLIINNTCIIINGSVSYDGDYCFDLVNLTLEDVALFGGATPVDCYITLDNIIGVQNNISYNWFNINNSIIESGSNLCDSGLVDCVLDELSGLVIANNDSILCEATINNSWFTFASNTTRLNTTTIGECDGINQYPIINLSYFDEVDGSEINTSYSYNVTFFEGNSIFNIFLNGTGEYTTICTDSDPAASGFNLNMYGNIILSASGYTTRVYNIPETAGFLASNNPYTNQSLFLVGIGNSSTIIYEWQTIDYEQIDGTMLIYRCEDDGSRTLIESNFIASGDATANLQLFSVPYSYAVVIDGVTYKEPQYYECHTESTTERSYLVDVSSSDIMPVIGLYLIDCEMTKVSDTVARMEWNANPNDNSDIEGCIVGYRELVGSRIEVYRDCVNQSSGSITRTVPTLTNNYYIQGEVFQNGYKGYCQNTLVYANRGNFSQAAGVTGVFSVGILIISLGLLLAARRTLALAGAGLGIVIAWLLGITSLNGAIVTGVITVLVIIILLIKSARKG